MKRLLSAPTSNQSFGLQAMTEEIHATFQIESIHSSRNSIRHILNGYTPCNEEEVRIYGMKRGLDFIADRQNTITEENLHQLYQISTGDYLPDEERLLWEYVLSAYGTDEFTTKQLAKDFRNTAYATIRTFVMKFHEMGLLAVRKAGNRVFYKLS